MINVHLIWRRKFLEKGSDLTLNNLLTIARAYEAADTQAKSIENQQYGAGMSNVNVVKKHTEQKGSWTPRRGSHQGGHPGSQGNTCYQCGCTNHFAKDKKCPAKGKNAICVINMTILLDVAKVKA